MILPIHKYKVTLIITHYKKVPHMWKVAMVKNSRISTSKQMVLTEWVLLNKSGTLVLMRKTAMRGNSQLVGIGRLTPRLDYQWMNQLIRDFCQTRSAQLSIHVSISFLIICCTNCQRGRISIISSSAPYKWLNRYQLQVGVPRMPRLSFS